eukprot:1157813-Pelagomonas_calceolata.AAC.4
MDVELHDVAPTMTADPLASLPPAAPQRAPELDFVTCSHGTFQNGHGAAVIEFSRVEQSNP